MVTAVVARKPEDCHRLISIAMTAGDLEGVLALYEPQAQLVPDPGAQPVSGEALKEAHRAFISLKPTLEVRTENVIQSGDIAVLRSNWTIVGEQPDGTPVTLANRGIEVVRRQPDGSWKYVIDNPFGDE